ncbi:MAG: hypothetical protein ACOYJY_05140 [Acutalibacteraceae bacterium]
MLTVKGVDESRRQELAECFGDPRVQALILREDENETGGVVYTMDPQEMRLLRFWTEDPFLRDFLLRATLNIGWRRGVKEARCALADMREFLLQEGFEADENEAFVTIGAFFTRPCPGHDHK